MLLFFQSIILGIIQGLTEFIPVSSSAHLVIAQHFFPLINGQPVILDLMLHFGSLLALIVYFWPQRKDILTNKNLLKNIILATIITAIIVFPFKKIVEESFSNPRLSGLMLMITGIILFLASRKKGNDKSEVGVKESIIVGIGQAAAVFPGLSRSGLTISSGIFAGLKMDKAIEFAFLLAIPIIGGAILLELPHFSSVPNNLMTIYLSGAFSSFIVSLLSLKLLKKILKLNQRNLIYFAYYCLVVGFLVVLFIK